MARAYDRSCYFVQRREYNNALRYKDIMFKRTLPIANLPEGVNHKLSEISYESRDGRRLTQPPVKIYSGQKLLESSKRSSDSLNHSMEAPVPGKIYLWDAPLAGLG
ncbi:unnamed protein product [Protopolystoma xenopodis]|uniref:NADH dehydrogenase [ubiquinone] 1 alpha subcomplex subunit 7 n=1 Tax=Protopolystoma xenopodis TaxID=117903 RepID=A0A3S5CTR1_9PLAT|nr:unnamed protein product [Protopolystoma xenopodis]